MEVLILLVTINTVVTAMLTIQIIGLRKTFDVIPYPEHENADEHMPDIIDVTETLSDFDKRIMAFQAEMNAPTYEERVAPILHPGVYNVPHNTVTDTPLRHEEEYSK